MTGEPSPSPFQRRIDDIERLDPFQARLDLLAADAGGIEQVLDVDVEALRLSSRTTPASEFSRSSLAITGDWVSTVAAPRIEDSGVRSSCDTEPISASRNCSVSDRILASLSARHVELLERSGGVGEHIVDPVADVGDVVVADVAEIDGDHPEVGVRCETRRAARYCRCRRQRWW